MGLYTWTLWKRESCHWRLATSSPVDTLFFISVILSTVTLIRIDRDQLGVASTHNDSLHSNSYLLPPHVTVLPLLLSTGKMSEHAYAVSVGIEVPQSLGRFEMWLAIRRN